MSGTSSPAVQFARIVAELNPTDSVLDRFCEAGQLMLDGDGAALTVNYDRPSRQTLSSTSSLALMIEDAQDVTGEGPGFEACRTSRVVSAGFGGVTPTPWPVLEDSIAALGFAGTILALPLRAADWTLGVLVVHRVATSLTFDPVAARFLTANLGAAVLGETTPAAIEHELTEDWSARAVVHQATGMAVVQLGIGADDALVVLRAHAYAQGASLLDIASSVVARELTFERGGERW
jgi:hypothetical protein